MARREGRARREKSPAVSPLALGWPNLPREGGQSAAFLGGQATPIFNVMIPLQPVSVKFTDEERAKLKALATALGWTESQVVRDSVAAIFYLVQHPEGDAQPKIIGMGRLALLHGVNPATLPNHVEKVLK
jgi:hypothetical protein